jgi:hypothetical protein
MWMLVSWSSALGWIGLHTRITTSDPAGNGIGSGVVQGFAALGLITTFGLAAIYLMIRWKPVRFICIALLSILSVVMIIFVR